jgi:hypothetical protein
MKLSDYMAIREAGKELGSKIFNYVVDKNKHELISTAKILKLWDGRKFIFNSENDSNVLMDYVVFEKTIHSTPAFKRFHLNNLEQNDLQQEYVNGMCHNYSSLFEVKSIDRICNTLVLADLLDDNRKEYLLMDIGLSKSEQTDFVLFTRLIPIWDIYMTSGVSFGFDKIHKAKLFSAISFHVFQKRRKLNFTEMYVLMHEKNRQFGMETRTEKTGLTGFSTNGIDEKQKVKRKIRNHSQG